MITRLPAPSAKYDAQNEAAHRRLVEQALSQLSASRPEVTGPSVGGAGTSGKIPLWGVGGSVLGDSSMSEAGGVVDFGARPTVGAESMAFVSQLFTTAVGDGRWVQIANFNTLGDARYRPIGYVPAWGEITSTPTTIGGYGITDFDTLGDARYFKLTDTALPGPFSIGDVSAIAAAMLRVGGDIRAGGNVNASDFVLEGPGGTPGPGGTGSPIAVYDETTQLTPEVSVLRFVGPGVVASNSGSDVTVTFSDLFTQAMADARYSMLGHTHTASQVTDFNAVGDARWLKLDGTVAMAGTLLALRGAFGISAAPSSGQHVEVYGDNTGGAILAYDRTGGAYLPLVIGASATTFSQGGIIVGGAVQMPQAIISGTVNPYVQFNDGTYNGYWQIASGNLDLWYNGATRIVATPTSGTQGYGQWDFLTADGGAYNMRVNTGVNVTMYVPLSMANNIVTNANNISLGSGIIGYDTETFTARGTTVPHYGWRWTTTTDGDGNVRMLGGAYGGISMFSGGVERLRLNTTGTFTAYTPFYINSDQLGFLLMPASAGSAVYMGFYASDGSSRRAYIGLGAGSGATADLYINSDSGIVRIQANSGTPIASFGTAGVYFNYNVTAAGDVAVGANVKIASQYESSLVGLYDPTKFRGIYAMGDSYKLGAGGTSLGGLYGLFFAYDQPSGYQNVSGLGLGHGFGLAQNGSAMFYCGASGLWHSGFISTNGTIRSTSTYGWMLGNQSGYNRIYYAPASSRFEFVNSSNGFTNCIAADFILA